MSLLRRLFPANEPSQPGPLSPGTSAPDFRLPSTADGFVRLSNHKGGPVILAFYPADSTPVCGSQLALYNDVLPMFDEFRARLLGISVDSIESHRAFAGALGLRFPLLSDAEPRGQVSASYGVLRERGMVSERALFVIDSEGIIAWSKVFPPRENPGADGILGALESLTRKGRGSG